MKILFLTSRVPFPPHRGDKLRTYNFLRTLANDYEIALVSFAESAEEREAGNTLARFCSERRLISLPRWRSWVHAALLYPFSLPSQAAYYVSPAMTHAVREIERHFRPDIVYIHLFRMIFYHRWLTKTPYTILDLTDVVSKELFRSIPYRSPFEVPLILREARRIRAYERRATTLVNETWVISKEDQQDMVAAGGEGKMHVIPNGLPNTSPPVSRDPDPHLLLFYGYAPVEHNRDALTLLLQKILPNVRKHLPAVRLAVVGAGRRPTPCPNGDDEPFPVEYHGFLDTPEVIFSRAALLTVPVRFSAGVQNKILEAMAAGVPVVTSPFGNEGIEGRDGAHLAVCGSADAFAERITYLLQHPEEREAMGKRGQAYVQSRFSWETTRYRMRAIENKIQSRDPEGREGAENLWPLCSAKGRIA